MVSKTDLFLKVSTLKGDNTPSVPWSTVIERKIPPSPYRVLLAVEEVNHRKTLHNLDVHRIYNGNLVAEIMDRKLISINEKVFSTYIPETEIFQIPESWTHPGNVPIYHWTFHRDGK